MMDLLRYFEVISAIVGVFAMIATLTPTKADDKVINYLVQLIHFIGMNFGKATNK